MTENREPAPQPEKKLGEMTFQEFLKAEESGKWKRDLAVITRLIVDLLREGGLSDEQIYSMNMKRVVEPLKGVLIRDFDRLTAYAPSSPEFVTRVLEFMTMFLEDMP